MAESASPLFVVAALLFGCATVVNGVVTWRHRHGPQAPPPSVWGSRCQYQSTVGSGAAGVPIGLGFVVIAIGLGVRDALGRPEHWAPWYVLAVIGAVLIAAGALYTMAYFWTGVPNWLRPPCQRADPAPRSRRTYPDQPRWKRLRQLRE